MTKNKNINLLLCFSLVICLFIGLMCNHMFNTTTNTINSSRFQSQLHHKEQKAAKTLKQLSKILKKQPADSLINYPFNHEDEISYYVFKKNKMIFWSENQLDISNITQPQKSDWHFVQLPNADCVTGTLQIDSLYILALIPIKFNYSYQNDLIENHYSKGFDLDKRILIKSGKKSDKNAVFCSHGEYLFTLTEPTSPILNKRLEKTGIIAFSLCFFLFFILLSRFPLLINRTNIHFKHYIYLLLSVGGLCLLGLYYDVPSILFHNKIFTPIQYASNDVFASIGHLTIITSFCFSFICLLFFYVESVSFKIKANRILITSLYGLYFLCLLYVIHSLCTDSTIKIIILKFKDLSLLSVWVHFIILIWGVGLILLFYKSHIWYKEQHESKKAFIETSSIGLFSSLISYFLFPSFTLNFVISFFILTTCFYTIFFIFSHSSKYRPIFLSLLIFTLFFEYNTYVFSNESEFEKFKILAENISINGNLGNDRMTDILIVELNNQIKNDSRINSTSSSLSKTEILDYLNKKYLKGFWNKYEAKIYFSPTKSKFQYDYDKFIEEMGTEIDGTNFHNINPNANNLSYVGIFQIKEQDGKPMLFYIELYPKSQYKSYSFPNLLIPSTPDIEKQLNIGIAKYENGKLVYTSENYFFSPNTKWIPECNQDYLRIRKPSTTNYIYKPDKSTCFVIAKNSNQNPKNLWIYLGYTFLVFLIFTWGLVWVYYYFNSPENSSFSLTSKFQISFIVLLIISFICIFFLSINYIETKYEKVQIENLQLKKGYVQKALQDLYYFKQDLRDMDTQNLYTNLQNIAYNYETDVIIYDNQGIMKGSSQPLIFSKKLISNRMSPTPFFKKNAEMDQQESVGKLKYLTGYIDFVNGDFLQLGYICIPQFYSQDELRAEKEEFISVIVHIYLIIIFLVIIITLFIGRRLSLPLITLETKLRQMKLGQRNEKIEYSQNDEIGQLVNQYNRTVDELEQSVKLLAQSERESAWKLMARQVAHEINNPLTPMKLTIQQLQRTKQMGDEKFDEYFLKSTKTLIEQIDNLSKIAGTFSNFAKMPEAKFQQVDVCEKLHSVVQLFSNNNESIDIHFNCPGTSIYVLADPEQLVQVFNNLLKNAIQAIPEERKGEINVSLYLNNKMVEISITDNGLGIDEEVADKLFLPNFTTKSTGMGLGLAISKNIIEITEGTITFETKKEYGTTFKITLPCINC